MTRTVCFAAAAVLVASSVMHAQQVVVGTPRQSVGDSFFENIGVGFRGRLPGGGVVNGPGAAPVPAFPGINPVGGANFGFGIRGGGANLGFNVGALQGSSRSFETIAPSVTIPNGGTGSIFSGSQTPFVTSIIPVVGGYGGYVMNVPRPYYPSAPSVTYPLHGKIQQYYAGLGKPKAAAPSYSASLLRKRALTAGEKLSSTLSASSSTAAHGDLSVAEIKRRRAARLASEDAAARREIEALVQRARGALDAGKPGVARIYLRQAATRAEGDLRKQLTQQLRALDK